MRSTPGERRRTASCGRPTARWPMPGGMSFSRGTTRLGALPMMSCTWPVPGLPEHALDLYVRDVRVQLQALLPIVALNGQPIDGRPICAPMTWSRSVPVRLVYQGRQAVLSSISFAPPGDGVSRPPLSPDRRALPRPRHLRGGRGRQDPRVGDNPARSAELPFKGVLRFVVGGTALRSTVFNWATARTSS